MSYHGLFWSINRTTVLKYALWFVNKITSRSEGKSSEISREGVQRDLLQFYNNDDP